MKRLIQYFVVLCCLVLTACGEEQKQPPPTSPKPVKSMVVGDKKASVDRDFSGKVLATTTAELSFEVSGKLIELPILEGSEKKKGALLAKLDDKRYKDVVKQAQAKFKLTEAQYERGKALVKQNFISKNEYDILKSNRDIAKANLSTAEKNLSDTVLYAPFDGFVAKKYVDNHEYVKAKAPVLSFHDVGHMDIEIQIPEYIVLQAKQGQKFDAYVMFEGMNKEYPIKLKEFSSTAEKDTQTYRTVFSMQAPKEINMLPGMSVTVRLKLPDYKNNQQAFFLIPASAVFSQNDKKSYVWLIDKTSHQISAQPVKVGNMMSGKIKVFEGLKQGDEIVTAGASFLTADQQVKPIQE